MNDINPQEAIEFIYRNAPKYAKAKSDRVHIEEFRKSKKALLMSESDEKSAVAREQFAYSHPDYLALLGGLKAAIEIEEKLRWDLIAAQARIEIWRTQSANNRAQDRSMQ